MFVYSFFDWFKFISVIYIRQKGLQAFQSALVKTLKFVGRPVSHKALSSAALLRGRPDGVVVNTSALESRGRGFKSRSGQFLGFSLCLFILSLTGLSSSVLFIFVKKAYKPSSQLL